MTTTDTEKTDNSAPTSPKPIQHSKFEDTLAILLGVFMVSFGLIIMQQAHLTAGGTAGLAMLLHYITGIGFGGLFFVVNLPFYYLAYRQLGVHVVIKTLIAVSLLSVMIELHQHFIELGTINPAYGAVLSNMLFGVGILILFRHGSSLGGFNLLALYLQKRYGIAAGKVLMLMDGTVLIASLLKISIIEFIFSIVGMVVLNMILTINHRQDRYIAI